MRRTLFTIGMLGVILWGVACLGWIKLGPDSSSAHLASAQDGSASRRTPLDRVDHTAWDRLLKKYVDADGMVNYRAWKSSSADRAILKQYLSTLGAADLSQPATKEGTLAYWINAYNALTVYGILDVYPTTSIRKHTAAVFGYNIWDDLPLTVGGQKYSLNQIEHKILRKQGEPRIHFAIVCASIGCPRLRNEAYVANRLETQLADNARDFFSRSKNLQIDGQQRIVYASSILDWFKEDFGRTPEDGLAGLSDYLPASAAEFVKQGSFRVKYLKYNWDLNEQ